MNEIVEALRLAGISHGVTRTGRIVAMVDGSDYHEPTIIESVDSTTLVERLKKERDQTLNYKGGPWA